MSLRLADFDGGLVLPRAKAAAEDPLRDCPLPPELVLPLVSPRGLALRALVEAGARVHRGQCLAHGGDPESPRVHAPAAGRIVAIAERPLPHPSGLAGPCLLLAPEGEAAATLPALDPASTAAPTLRARLAEAGVVGLGGGAFPTAAKLARPAELLIVNGAECEPWVACDHVLLREDAGAVLEGSRLLGRVLGAKRVLVAIEDAMQTAARALAAAAARMSPAQPAVVPVTVPTRYPAGGERQLIRVLTGREVPAGGLPADLGVVCVNVATAAAAWRAVVHGEALTHRLVSVAGGGVARPATFRVAIGTPAGALIAAAGGYTASARRLVFGGPLTGFAVRSDAVPVSAATHSVLALGADELRASGPELPCIRCGECARVCPARLQPQELLARLLATDLPGARELHLDACIECGLCAWVCPSQIPLVAWYRHGKTELRAADAAARAASEARARHEARTLRLAREAEAEAVRLAARRAELQASGGSGAGADAVAAALARARARRAAAASAADAAPAQAPRAGDDGESGRGA